MRKFLPILLALIMSIGIVSLNQQLEYNTYANLELNTIQEEAIIEQAVISVSPNINTIQKVYMKEQLIGVLSEQANIDAFLRDVYAERYAQDFPNTSLGFGEDIFVTLEESYMSYENKDSDIFSYLRNQDYFSVEADKVAFSNGAVIYVKSIELFEQAKDLYLQNFISKEALDLIRINKLPPELVTYGTRDIGFNVIEKANYQRGMAPAEEIMTTIPQIVYFLSYGYGTEIETYTVIEYDTGEGIAYKSGLPSTAATKTIRVKSNPTVTVTSPTICSGGTATLQASGAPTSRKAYPKALAKARSHRPCTPWNRIAPQHSAPVHLPPKLHCFD